MKPKTLIREEIEPKYKWDFTHIFPNWDAWEIDFEKLKQEVESFKTLKGSLGKSASDLLIALVKYDQIEISSYKVYAFPALQKSADNRDNTIQAKLQEVMQFFALMETATSWMAPELRDIPKEIWQEWMQQEPKLEPYRFSLENLHRQQNHILTEDKERLMSFFISTASTAANAYTNLTTADVQFPEIELQNGEKLKLTHGNYAHLLNTSKVRVDRKNAADAFYPLYANQKNTIASLYKGICDKDFAFAQARNFNSSLEAKLEKNNIPQQVYTNLIETVGKHTDALRKYHQLRAKHLGLSNDYHGYDSRVSLVDFDKKYDWEEAKAMVLASIQVLGSDYANKYQIALENGWIDVFENDGKSSGAYSMGVYGVHPFILMNYNETQDHVFTLAHEMGHSLHTMLSEENQPFSTHEYTIFVAEVASTFNERLLLDFMLKKSKDKQEKIALLQQSIENITGTFFIQSMFADFELRAHQVIEQGQALTADSLTEICEELDLQYYGEDVFTRDQANIFWARIPHFYRSPFYVYQYATSFAASASLYQQVKEGLEKGDQKPLEKYLNLLKSGGNNYPVDQLKLAGADLTKPETILAVIQQLSELVDALETALKEE
ncbi:MAG: oligoendopeptidase F [Bacteroidales bacterium]|nr:oligoendopeptidase F [Bacteroidales bacterium]